MRKTMEAMGQIYRTAGIKATGSSLMELFETRIRQAASEPTLLRFLDRLSMLMLSAPFQAEALPALADESQKSGPAMLAWIRDNIRIAAALAILSYKKPSEFEDALASIPLTDFDGDVWDYVPTAEVGMTIKTLTPLTHGGDEKAGNATMFRRMAVLARNGRPLLIPFYAGNAIRGQVRDLLADEFLTALGLTPSCSTPPVELWFFHTLYAGGSLTSEGVAPKKARKAAGINEQAESIDRRADFRARIPMLSLLGMAMGNTIMDGKVDFLDAIPACLETGLGDTSYNDMLSWQFLTRRDDLDAPHDENTSMIANWEVLIPGVVLRSGVSTRPQITDLERSCLWSGLELLKKSGVLGGSVRRGWGRVEVSYTGMDGEAVGDAAPELYRSWLRENASGLREFLADIGAI